MIENNCNFWNGICITDSATRARTLGHLFSFCNSVLIFSLFSKSKGDKSGLLLFVHTFSCSAPQTLLYAGQQLWVHPLFRNLDAVISLKMQLTRGYMVSALFHCLCRWDDLWPDPKNNPIGSRVKTTFSCLSLVLASAVCGPSLSYSLGPLHHLLPIHTQCFQQAELQLAVIFIISWQTPATISQSSPMWRLQMSCFGQLTAQNSPKHLVYYNRSQRKPANIHIWEVGTNERLAFFGRKNDS